MGAGFYLQPTHPDFVKNLTKRDIYELIVNEFINGVDDTGIKIVINSHATTTADKRRIPIENFKQLTSLKKINFFIIQKDFDKNKMKIVNKYSNVNYFEDMDKTVKPFEDTIGIIKNLDLIITADTSLGHLSATLGKKTWIALPFVSDWRWFRDEKKSVWYENVTLYKQKQIGNWEEIFKSIKEDLKRKFSE